MTLQDLIRELGDRPWLLIAGLAAPPLLSWLMGYAHSRQEGGKAPWRYGYALLVYLACVPGIFASVLTGYALFFRNDNLLEVDVLVYALPIATMAMTLLLIGRNADFTEIPGFERLSGLMLLIAASFAIALAIQKIRVLLIFGSSVTTLFVLAGAFFVALKWGASMAFRRG